MLVNEHYQEALKAKVPESKIDDISEENAEISFNSRIQDFRSSANVPCVRVSTDDDYPGLSPCFSTSSLKISWTMQRLSDWNHFGNWLILQGSACIVSKETSGFCGPQLSKSVRIRKLSAPLGVRLSMAEHRLLTTNSISEGSKSAYLPVWVFPWSTHFRNRILDGFGKKHSLSGTYSDRMCSAYPQRHSQGLEFQWPIAGR